MNLRMEESPHKALGQIGVALNALFWAKLLRDFGECISLLIAKLFPSFRTEGSPCPEVATGGLPIEGRFDG